MKFAPIVKKLIEQSKPEIKKAAGAIIIAKDTKRILLQFRSNFVDEPLTWGTVGGGLNSKETPESGCKREIEEETGYSGNIKLELLTVFTNEDSTFEYHNFLGIVTNEFEPICNSETIMFNWFELGSWPIIMHYGLRDLIENEEVIKKIKSYQ